MERCRGRVVQVTFSTPGIRRPEKEISDDELLGTLQQIIGQLEGYDVTSGQNVICGLLQINGRSCRRS